MDLVPFVILDNAQYSLKPSKNSQARMPGSSQLA